MKRIILLALLATLVAMPMGSVAFAHHDGHEFDTADQCMSSGTGIQGLPSCSRSGDGPWVAQYGQRAGSGIPPAFGMFLAFAVLWAAAPAVIGGFVASSRGQSVGLAVVLGILLGWIGLVIVVVAFKPEVTRAARNVIDVAGRPPMPMAPARPDVRSRLQELEQLKKDSLITTDEYESRRAEILQEI